ncbi:MAG: 5-formyltetrahydrofolate cyclo-ligase [Clostridia bacterium]|nr:5-formyltetrahydrofolate cyclo-ligase [Clostridia bacterium]
MIHKTKGTEIRAQKNEIRAKYKSYRASLSSEERSERDRRICSLFLSSISYRYAKVILMYAPLDGEIDVMPIAAQALADGKTVAFPRCKTEDCTMEYHIVTSLDELLPGYYGIREPADDAPVWHPGDALQEEHPVCIIPGLVFDRAGYRVGYGKGYYDRFLITFPGVRVGMVYSDCVLPSIPRGRYDLSVDVLVTEKGVRAIHAN